MRCLVEKQAEGPAHVLHDRVLKPELLEGDPRHELTQPVEPSHIVKGGIGDVQVVAAEEDKVTTPQRLASMLVSCYERGPGHTSQRELAHVVRHLYRWTLPEGSLLHVGGERGDRSQDVRTAEPAHALTKLVVGHRPLREPSDAHPILS